MKISSRIILSTFSISLLFSLYSCKDTSLINEYEVIQDHQWSYADKKNFQFEVVDTSMKYDIYLNIRHTGEYPYSNIWMFIRTIFPYDSLAQSREQIVLADQAGKWYAKSSGDVWDHQILLQEAAYFPDPGTYGIELEQNMRLDPLPHIIAVGIKVDVHPASQAK